MIGSIVPVISTPLENEAAKVIERDAPVRRHDGRGATLFDERRTLYDITWRQLVSVED